MNPAPALITILMPLRNAAATVRHTLDSILAQTLRDWELVAVDDGSVDETAEIVRSEARADSCVRLVVTPPQGIARALQAGCEAATGGWLARMDGDDWMHLNRLAEQWKFSQENPRIDVISCLVGYGGESPGWRRHCRSGNTRS